MEEENDRLSKGITGIAGEYYVAAELSRRGFMASVTLRNNDSVDIHASKLSENKIFAIQVKTNQDNNRSWILAKKAESNKSDKFFYVFVAFNGEKERPEFFIVSSVKVADYVTDDNKKWLNELGRNGNRHQENDVRKFRDIEGRYLERWDLLS